VWRNALVLVVLLAPTWGCNESVTATGDATPYASIEWRVHALTNQYRATVGKPPLEWSEVIAAQCRIHSTNMATGVVAFGHDGFDERSAAIAESIPHSNPAENVAQTGGGSDPAQAAVTMWLNSDGHRRNIEADHDMAAVGVARASGGTYFFTQFFLLSR
jgi:uncharacterized protein YkwD